MRIFVTGATGVIGTRVVPALVAQGHTVTAVGRTEEKRAALARAGAEPVAVDLYDAAAVQRAVAGHDAICNLATAVPPGSHVLQPWAWGEMDRVRTEVSANLAKAALATDTVGLLIQEAFAPIYEDAGDTWVDETAPIRAARYNRSVLQAEARAMEFTQAGRIGVVLRFAGLYGPGDGFTTQIIDTIRGGWSPFLGRGNGFMSWVSHDDAASAVLAALRVPAGVYNVVEDSPMRRRALAIELAQLLGVKPPKFLPGWAARIIGPVGETLGRSLRISNQKLKDASAWMPRYATMVVGVRAMVGVGRKAGRREGVKA